jgi:hypothetical protein
MSKLVYSRGCSWLLILAAGCQLFKCMIQACMQGSEVRVAGMMRVARHSAGLSGVGSVGRLHCGGKGGRGWCGAVQD